MPGMSRAGAPANPALAFVLALFMLGYVLWTTDQLATLRRVRVAAPDSGPAALAPRFAALARIAMAIVMGNMLIAPL
jgi:hypothetical protein